MLANRHQKVKGVIQMLRGEDSARIKVLSFKRNDEYVYKAEEIKMEFPPEGYIFAPNLFARNDFELNLIIEFSTTLVDHGPGPDLVKIDPRSSLKKTGWEVFTINEVILISPFSLNQPKLKEYIREANTQFYIRNFSSLYGPFTLSGVDVKPAVNREVNSYSNFQVVSVGKKDYLLEEPTEITGKIECLTNQQIAGWFRETLKTLSLSAEIEQLPKLLEAYERNDMDKDRMSRALAMTRELLLSRRELEILAQSSKLLEALFDNSLERLKEELRLELVVPFQEKQIQLEKECSRLQKEKLKTQKEFDTVSSQKEILTAEVQHLEQNKERLIKDIRAHGLVHESPFAMNVAGREERSPATFEIQSYPMTSEAFADLADFLSCYSGLFENVDHAKGNGKRTIFQLKHYRALLCDNPKIVQFIAKYTNNARLFIQQVEPDWLKFGSFYENGLRQCWESATENPGTIHFLLMEDLNLASIECYGRPLLDLLSELRQGLPGLRTPWPANLWIFGIPVEPNEDHRFGLPLIPHSFRHWGALPIGLTANGDLPKDERFLPVNMLADHAFESPSVSLNEYLS